MVRDGGGQLGREAAGAGKGGGRREEGREGEGEAPVLPGWMGRKGSRGPWSVTARWLPRHRALCRSWYSQRSNAAVEHLPNSSGWQRTLQSPLLYMTF